MARETLKSFYDSSAWRKQRLMILKRDHYTCTHAGCHKVATEVHHKIELNEDNVNDLNISLNEKNLTSLCHDCHTKLTKEIKAGTNNILQQIMFDSNGFPIAIKE